MKKYSLFVILILFTAIVLRFYDFPRRFWIYADQARDVMVSRGALEHKTLPLIGSFSSAGPFVFGPLFYWFIMASYLVVPKLLTAPWIFLTLIDVLAVYLMIQLGRKIGGLVLGLICGLFSALSTNQLMRASDLTQHTFVIISTVLTALFFTEFLKKRRGKELFFMGLSIGLGINMHYQALNLLLFPLAILAFQLKKGIRIKPILSSIGVVSGGILIQSLPLLIWDYDQQWANLRNLMDYFLLGQYRIWISQRWLTYVAEFWPSFWARVIGGNKILGIFLIFLLVSFGLHDLFKKKLNPRIFWLGLIFLLQMILYRYSRTERFWGYILYFQPLVVIFSSWVSWRLIKIKKTVGYLFLFLIIIFTMQRNLIELKKQDNGVKKVTEAITWLKQKYPKQKFRVYDYYFLDPGMSQMLSLFLDFEGMIEEENGVLIGVSQGKLEKYPPPIYKTYLEKEFDFYHLEPKILEEDKGWTNVNPDFVYEDILFWWQKKPLNSTFSLKDYLKSKL